MTAGATPMIQARELDLTFARSGAHAMRQVSFDIPAGSTLALVGESGSGKSTTARTVLGLQRPDSGSVIVSGRDVHRLGKNDLRMLRRDMQVVLQDPFGQLNRRHTVGQIVQGPLKSFGIGTKLTQHERALELIRAVGLEEQHLSRRPSELSGGQCQRVSIARALAVQPQVLVLDEAVSALDVSVRAQVLNLLKRVQKEFGLTYLFITHDLGVARYMAHDIAVMQSGQIVEHGSREQIFTDPQHPYTRSLLASVPTRTRSTS